ncbi:MAG: efflux RND transporter permease subunit, partial [Candidatus Cryptobacteroides sp.]
YIQDKTGGDIDKLKEHSDNFIRALNARDEVAMAYTTFDTKFPQYRLEIDAARCKRLNVQVKDVLSVISGYVGGSYSSNFNRFSKLYRVIVQASSGYRLDASSLDNMFVRTSDGQMAPVGQFVRLEKTYGAESLSRFNMYNCISVNGTPAEGYSSSDAIAAIREVASQTLPTGYGYEFGGISREEAGSDNTALIFTICIFFIYLILCGLYESVFIPLAVILSVPFGLAGSFLFARAVGLENNIYMQTGLIMLIGLLSKTAILLTEYASTRRKEGMSIRDAALSAAGVRFRPILMTALTLVIGMLPLVFASGAGANGNISLGVGVIGGMLTGTLALLFVVPALFTVFQYIQEKLK